MIRALTAAALSSFCILISASPAFADKTGTPNIDFGDDTGRFANDSECDDPRFEGPGAAHPSVNRDMFRDASDCRRLFDGGEITLIASAEPQRPPLRVDGIQFGSDTSEWALDDECDDPRFSGSDMAFGTLDPSNAYADRSDCLAAWQAGRLTYNADWRFSDTPPPSAAQIDAIDFGEDTSDWIFDYECDDPRFEGIGMAVSPLASDIRSDATDCRMMFMMGQVVLKK